MESKTYSALDQEVITLAAVWDLIGSMVNYAHFEKEHRLVDTFLMFKTREASKLFLIILADFLSLPRDGTFGLPRLSAEGSLGRTYLGHLTRVASNPSFSGDTAPLASAVVEFATWLDGFAVVEKVWLPSIEREGTLSVQRMAYLKICGTISKHGFTRLGDIVEKIRSILADNGTRIDEGQSYMVIPEFREWFRDDVFIASATLIAWHLNELRWGIYRYLRTEFERAYTPTKIIQGMQMYEYDVPPGINEPLVRSMYWDLMNNMRGEPYFPRFSVSRHLRDIY